MTCELATAFAESASGEECNRIMKLRLNDFDSPYSLLTITYYY